MERREDAKEMKRLINMSYTRNCVDGYSLQNNGRDNDIDQLSKTFGMHPNSRRLFIDSSKTNLKAILLNNGKIYPSIPIGYA